MKSAVLSAILLAASVLADSAVMYEFPDGRTVAMVSSSDISMAAESVFIQPAEGMWGDGDDEGWLPSMRVRCLFQLVNHSGSEQFVTVGFPLDAKYGDAYTAMDDEMLFEELTRSYADEERPPWNDEMVVQGLDAVEDVPGELDFHAFAEGQELEVFYRKCALSLEEDMLWRPVVAVWKMRFDPGETIWLENTYNTSWDYFAGGPWREYTINYILTSGGTWSGPIGRAYISLTLPEELPAPCLNDTMVAYWHWSGSPVMDGRTVVWEYTDLEPDENLRFTVDAGQRLGFWESSIDPVRLFDTVEWTEGELLNSIQRRINEGDFWGMQIDSELALRIAEALPRASQGAEPLNGIRLDHFSVSQSLAEPVITPVMEERLELVNLLQGELQDKRTLADDEGYLEFLPMFVSRYRWNEEDADMYRAMPSKEVRYLELLGTLEAAVSGEPIDDPAVRAFYELTGWYFQGVPNARTPIPARLVEQYRSQ